MVRVPMGHSIRERHTDFRCSSGRVLPMAVRSELTEAGEL
jgi:hypothetical protein